MTNLGEWIGQEVGLRVVDSSDGTPSIGQALQPSRVWDDGEPTDELLDGTSAIDARYARATELLDAYIGDIILVIETAQGGLGGLRGEDEGEVIVRRAVVLAVYHR